MPNYRPKGKVIPSASAISGTAVVQDVTASTWGLFLLKGTALDVSESPIASGTVQVWEGAAPTTGPATRMTFTNADGIYGVTCRANVVLTFKFYDN